MWHISCFKFWKMSSLGSSLFSFNSSTEPHLGLSLSRGWKGKGRKLCNSWYVTVTNRRDPNTVSQERGFGFNEVPASRNHSFVYLGVPLSRHQPGATQHIVQYRSEPVQAVLNRRNRYRKQTFHTKTHEPKIFTYKIYIFRYL